MPNTTISNLLGAPAKTQAALPKDAVLHKLLAASKAIHIEIHTHYQLLSPRDKAELERMLLDIYQRIWIAEIEHNGKLNAQIEATNAEIKQRFAGNTIR